MPETDPNISKYIQMYLDYTYLVRSAHKEASNAAPVVRGCSLHLPLPALPRRTGCHGSIAGARLEGLEAQLGAGNLKADSLGVSLTRK